MPKIKKKGMFRGVGKPQTTKTDWWTGKAGQAKNFITRTQAVRKLQISLPDFRRLCIFKGVKSQDVNLMQEVSD